MTDPLESLPTPPRPDVPVDNEPMTSRPQPPHPDEVDEAKQRIASRMEQGGTPYDFSGALEGKSGGGVSSGNVAAGVALAGLAGVVVIAIMLIGDLWGKIDSMSATVSDLSDRMASRSEQGLLKDNALLRAELLKTIAILDRAIALDDPKVADEARKLKTEAEALLAQVPVPPQPAPSAPDSVKAGASP